MHEFTVRPCGASGGWLIEHEAVQPMRFLSGADAESTARALVQRLAEAGQPARASILLRDGSLAGRITRF